MLAINAVPSSGYLIADKGYTNAFRSWLFKHRTTPLISTKFNRKIQIERNRNVYCKPNVVERMFCRFEDWRRVATRLDRNVKSFMATVAIAAFVTWWL